ncbi:MAG: hypothetical protein M5U09_19385 [Gammaproteobacteria bacterium]|nr:hypothetical protein [Gammaproteobacteria bacterium]
MEEPFEARRRGRPRFIHRARSVARCARQSGPEFGVRVVPLPFAASAV